MEQNQKVKQPAGNFPDRLFCLERFHNLCCDFHKEMFVY
jgi:hypothetical protein